MWDFRRTKRGILARLDAPEEGLERVEVDWLVGCDGVSSTVRHQLDMDFTGTEYPQNFHLADLYLDWELKPDKAHQVVTDRGFVPAIPLPEDGLWRLIDAAEPTPGAGSEDS